MANRKARYITGISLLAICLLGLTPEASAVDAVENADTYMVKLRDRADQGDPIAENTLGNAYWIGMGVIKDEAGAVKWWQKAAEQGNAEAQASLGTMYSQGKGVLKDAKEAMKWWNKAAEQGNANAQDQIGFAYLLGDGVAQDNTAAYMWFNISAANGDKHAANDRNTLANYMAAELVARAQDMAAQWMQQHPGAIKH